MIRVVALGEDIWEVLDRNLCGSAPRNISDIREIHLHVIVTLVVKGFKSQTEILNYSLWSKTQYSWETCQVLKKAGHTPTLKASLLPL